MPESDLLYRVALAWLPGIGPVYTKKLLKHFGDARAIFHARAAELISVNGMGKSRVNAIRNFDKFQLVEEEIAFLDRYGIRCLFLTDKDYPQRLLACKEAPIVLFYKGNADLNVQKIVSIVGTRGPTEYGKQAVERLIRDLAGQGPLIISGLAYGIDTSAHKSALSHSLSTVAVLGHGLDQMYPPENKSLAARMIRQGGLVTNFHTRAETSPHNFPLRNRIIAGMCDALVVAETDSDGGSMLTVKDALLYKKKIFAFPGRLSDKTSSGCNQMIQQGTARLLLDAAQLVDQMGWGDSKMGPGQTSAQGATRMPEKSIDLPIGKIGGLPAEKNKILPADIGEGLSDHEKLAMRLLSEHELLGIDEFSEHMNTTFPVIALALINLELRGLIRCLPGKKYRLAV